MIVDLVHAAQPNLASYQLPTKGVELIKQFTECHLKSCRQHPSKSWPNKLPIDNQQQLETQKTQSPGPNSEHSPHLVTYTAGWGSTCDKNGQPFTAGTTLKQTQANELLHQQLQQSLLPHLVQLPGWDDLNENQQGALLSFAHSLGEDLFVFASQLPLAKALRDRRWYLVPDILKRYYGPNPGADIVRRRQAEAQLFLLEIRQNSYTLINQSRQLMLTTPALQGHDVKVLQQALGHYGYEIVQDGIFGPLTQWAIEKFQDAVGLPLSGIADVQTQRILHARPLYLNDPYLIGSDVRQVQSQLDRIGYDVDIDGIFGLQTWRAVIYFQAYFNLPETGVVQGKTLTQLLYLPALTHAA
ncbi:MAG: peptidoglycan-binding protein [Cyanobacteria bacterium J06598_3]